MNGIYQMKHPRMRDYCGNWTQVLEQLHSQQLPITHANYSQKETEYGAKH